MERHFRQKSLNCHLKKIKWFHTKLISHERVIDLTNRCKHKMSHTLMWNLYDTALKNELTDEQKNDAAIKLLQGTCTICDSVSLSAIKRGKICCSGMQISFWDILTRVMTWQHILIQNTEFRFGLLNFGKDAAKLDRVQNRAQSAVSLTAQEGSDNGAFTFRTGEDEWVVGRCSPESLCEF